MFVHYASDSVTCNAELESDVEDGGDMNGEDEWEDDDGESGYVHGRRLVLSVADEPTALEQVLPCVTRTPVAPDCGSAVLFRAQVD